MSPNPEYVLGDGQRELQPRCSAAGAGRPSELSSARSVRVCECSISGAAPATSAFWRRRWWARPDRLSASIARRPRSRPRAPRWRPPLWPTSSFTSRPSKSLRHGPFDALIGRFVLMYFSNPVATLRQLLPLVRSRGVERSPSSRWTSTRRGRCRGWPWSRRHSRGCAIRSAGQASLLISGPRSGGFFAPPGSPSRH